MPRDDFLEINNLIKRFGKKIVLDRVNLEIPLGSFYGILGLSGSGKTTLLNILVGFWKQTVGEIYYKGKNISKRHKRYNSLFGFATQGGSVYPNLTVEENLFYFGRLYSMKKKDIKARAEILLDLINLAGANKVLAGELSTGMQRRLDIACALIHNPKILILDEPTEDLDPVLRKELLALLKRINDLGTTIIMTSHMLNDVEAVCDQVAILHKGYIVESGTPNELKAKYSKNEEIHLITSPGNYKKLAKQLAVLKFNKIIVKRKKIIIYTPKADDKLRKVLDILKSNKERLVDLKLTKPSMTEIFEAITQGS